MPRLKESLKLDALLRHADRSLALCLAATALCAWFLVNCLQAQMAFLIDDYSLRTSLPQWHPTWPLGPWLLAMVGLALAYVRMRFFGLDLRRRLLQLSVLTVCLIALRLGVLWTPLGILMPYLAILWAPHLTWVLGLLFLLYLHAPLETLRTGGLSPAQTSLIAGLLFIGSALLYGAYTLYFCQTTMLHGDEAHYLQLTQSLLYEGDMDLSDNIAFAKVREFHIVEVGVHKALASPPDKIYSVHPIGLSVLLVPAYWASLQWWGNPRLGCALFMALLTAACIALAFIWLVRLRIAPLTAALATAITGLAVPVFIYNNQIYPEIPALFINLLILAALAHWQRPTGGYRSLGRGEWALLGLLTLLLAGLPFLHPRFLPLAGLGGLLVLLQAWHSPQRPFALAAVGTATLAGLISLVTFNFAFSGDWMGHFHSGNAWGEGVLRLSTLATSLPGQWLQRDMGLGNSSPAFFFALLGLVFLLHKSSHSLRLLIISFYFATLVVNGLNGADWVMGYCYPARFFVAAVPLLLLGLTAFLDTSYSRPVLLFFFLCALSITLDTVIEISKVPERGFIGYVLPVRAINYFYPWDVHFYPEKDRAWPLGDLTFWGALLAGAFSLLYYREKMPLLARAGLPLLLALLPYLWGKSTVLQDRVRQYFHTFTVTTAIADATRPEHHFTAHFPLTRSSIYTTGDYLPNGTFSAQENKNSPGLLSSHTISILKPGIYQLAYSNMQSVGPTDRPVGYALISQRDNVAAFSKWEKRINLPIKDALHDTWSTAFYVDRTNIGYAQIAFRGLGRLSHQHVNLIKIDGPLNLNVEPFHYFPLAKKAEGGAGIAAGGSYTALPTGAYKARFEVSGASLSTFFKRAPAPIKMAIFTRPVGIESAQEIKERFAQWLKSDSQSNSATALDFLPLVESTQAPWWTAIPIGSDTAFEIFFSLEEPQDIWFLIGYRGPEEIEVEGIALDRVTLAL